jgi:hypothetical protein
MNSRPMIAFRHAAPAWWRGPATTCRSRGRCPVTRGCSSWAGFGNNEPGLVFAAAEVVAQLALHGRAAHASVFTPRRFL